MKSISRAVLVFIGAAELVGCATPFQVKRIDPATPLPDNALIYALPRAKIVVEIPVTREKREKADCTAAVSAARDEQVRDEFEKVLSKHGLTGWTALVPRLGEDGASHEYKLTADQAPTLTIQSEPDPDAVFAVDVASEKFKKKSLALTLNDAGLLESGGLTAEDATTEVVVEVITTVVTIAVSVAALLDPDVETPKPKTPVERCRAALDRLEKLDKRQQEIVKEREDLLSRAKVSSDPTKALSTAKLLLDDVKARKDEILDRFRGVVVEKEVAKIRCTVTPSSTEKEWPLLTLQGGAIDAPSCDLPEGWKPAAAATAGPTSMPAANPGGAPAPTDAAPGGSTGAPATNPGGSTSAPAANPAGATVIRLVLTEKQDPVLDTARRSKNLYGATEKRSAGFVYRVPARTSLKLSQVAAGKTSVYSTTDAAIPQLGVLLALPDASTIKNTKANYSLAVHPTSGAAKEIKIEYGTGAVPDTSALAKEAAPLLDKASPHKRLEKEKSELELEQAIFELRCAKLKREGLETPECKAAEAAE